MAGHGDDDENILNSLTVSEMFYQPPPRQQTPPRGVIFTCGDFDSDDTSLLVGHRQWWTRDAELEAELARYGPIKKLRMFYDRVNGMPRVYAQVRFFDPAAAAACRERMASGGRRAGGHHGFGGMTLGGQRRRPAVLYPETPVVVGPPRPAVQLQEARVSRNQSVWENWGGGGGALRNSGGNVAGMVGPRLPPPPGMLVGRLWHPVVVGRPRPAVHVHEARVSRNQPAWANWGGGGGGLWNSGGNVAGMVGPRLPPPPPGMLVGRLWHPVIVGPWRPVVVHSGAVLGQVLHVNPAFFGIWPPPGSA